MKILIENGHGIDTKGKRSPDGRLLEYTQNRLLAGRIVTALQARGLDASLLVPEEADIPLPERCRRVNEWCRQLVKIQLTAPGRCRHLGILRNYLADEDCAAGVVSVAIPGYAGVWDLIWTSSRSMPGSSRRTASPATGASTTNVLLRSEPRKGQP